MKFIISVGLVILLNEGTYLKRFFGNEVNLLGSKKILANAY